MEDKRSLKLAFRLMYLAGLKPHINNVFSKVNMWALISFVVIIGSLILTKMLGNLSDIDILVSTFESMMTLYQVLVKLIVCQVNRKKFMRLLDKMEGNFWSIANYQDDNLRVEVKNMMQLFWRFHLTYVIGSSLVFFGFVLKPAFNSGRLGSLICWMPEGNPSPLYEFLYLIESYVLYSVMTVVVGFDIFFVSVNTQIVAQFKMLRYDLKNVIAKDENLTFMNLKRCIRHHKLLLDCANDMLQACSWFLLNQYFIFIITICMEMYSLTENNDLAKVLNCVVYLCMIFFEASLTCVTPTMLEEEVSLLGLGKGLCVLLANFCVSSKVGTAVYLSNWCDVRSNGICKSMRLIMMRSQSTIQFTAGGLFIVNVQCLTVILNTGVSYYTLLKHRKHA